MWGGRAVTVGPGDIYAAEMDREEREEAERVRECHKEGEDCGDEECEECAERRQQRAHEDGERCEVEGCLDCGADQVQANDDVSEETT